MGVALAKKTDERGALRLAIENKAAVVADLAKRQDSLEAALKHVAVAEERLRTASAAVGEARSAHVERVARALADGREPPTAILADKRDTVEAAHDEADAMKAAVAQIEAGIAALEVDVAAAENAVLVQVNALLAGVLARKFEAAKRKQVELLVLKNELHGLVAKEEAPPRFADNIMDYKAGRERDAALPLRDSVIHFLNVDYPDFPDEVRMKVNAAQRSWEQVRRALRVDADAVIED